MNRNKKIICMGIAAAVSVCFVVTLVSTVQVVASAIQSGAAVPSGMIMLTLVTLLCSVLIWKGVRDMD